MMQHTGLLSYYVLILDTQFIDIVLIIAGNNEETV